MTYRMKIVFGGMLALLWTSAHAPARAGGRMPTGAFLRRPVASVADLSAQIAGDRLVQRRYERIFHLKSEALSDSFRSLRLIRLPEDRLLKVHYVHPDEVTGFRLRRVRRGTPVFVLPDGTPLLAQACGNPLQNYLHSEEMIPPEIAFSVPDFDANEPLPKRTSTLQLTLNPMRSATPSTKLSSPKVASGGGGGGIPRGGFPILPLFALPAVGFGPLVPFLPSGRAGHSLAFWPNSGTQRNPPLLDEFPKSVPRPDQEIASLTPEPGVLAFVCALLGTGILLMRPSGTRAAKSRGRRS